MSIDFSQWEPVYETIRADFGYDREADERARDQLHSLTKPFDEDRSSVTSDSTVVIAGAGPSLSTERSIEVARTVDTVFAASTAVDVLEAAGVEVDWMVTDLDKNPETVRRLTDRGTPVAVHAHGDNEDDIAAVVPHCPPGSILPTTQVRPRDHVVNVGGFTDGDRAAYLADALGASRLRFIGWDFDDPAVDPVKAKKLEWAERLLYWLEHRRRERFDVLDGRRGEIDASALPIE